MASYIPKGQSVPHWQSEAQTPGPVRRNATQATRSGSNRSYASTWKAPINFSRSGAIMQNTIGQAGNYLLYRDAVAYANSQHEEQVAKEKDQELQVGVGAAASAMLGGPSYHSPGKQSMARGTLGASGTPSLGAPQTGPKDPFGRVATDQFGGMSGGGRQAAWVDHGTLPPQGNTNTPAGPQGRDPMQQRRTDAQRAADRPAGGKIGGMLKGVPKDLTPPDGPHGQGRLF